ncbi:hypothetical protein ACMGE7_00540 [Macrococcus equi]|uniref:hypothetical protein n=1 Tax=Macrococcus equi TaxID=3395462 RepID=UPI0039BDE5DC
MNKFKQIAQSELLPDEQLGLDIYGTIHFPVGDQTEFDGAYIATSERLFMNVDMGEKVYERVVGYNEVNQAIVTEEGIMLEFHMGNIPMSKVTEGDKDAFVNYINEQVEKVKKRQDKVTE